jgi:glycolate oxidase FAD binding subunit
MAALGEERQVRMNQGSPLDTDTIAGELAVITGADAIHGDDSCVSAFVSDASQISSIMRYADRNGITVHPQGAGTKRRWHKAPEHAIILCTEKLNQLKEHVWQDMTCTVDAGMRWTSMQEQLMRHGQFVALDPLWPDDSTVGGVLSVNDSGALRWKYGSLRDLVIGMTIVLPDGTIAKCGGKVVKNVAGYDMQKLMIGAYGTLAIIAEVTFRLHSFPRNTKSFTITSADAEVLGRLSVQIVGSQLSLQSLQLRSAGSSFYLDVCIATLPEVLKQQELELEELVMAAALHLQDGKQEIWKAREAMFAGTDEIVVKVSMLPTNIGSFAKQVQDLGGKSVTQAGGLMIATFSRNSEQALRAFRDNIERAGGSLSILGWPADSQTPLQGTIPESLPHMQRLKKQFDPNGILNPGVLLGAL